MLEPIDREEVLRTLQTWGALQPLEVKRKLGKGESMMIGAVLSELAHHKKVAISKLKRGGSPFYYVPEKPEALERVAQYLGEKDKRTFDLLQEKKVVDPTVVEPLTRVSLSNIVDYSRKFEYQGKEYYRYYLTTEEEAIALLAQPTETPKKEPEQKPESTTPEKKEVSKKTSKPSPTPKKTPQKTVQKKLKKITNEVDVDDEFLQRIVRYCNNKGLTIENSTVVRKKQELDLTIMIPSAVGKVRYFCKAKSKKKSNDGDVAGALLAAQRQQLPAMYLTTGEVTKKAKEMPELAGVLIKEIKP